MIKGELVATRVRRADGRVTEVCLTEKGDQQRKLALAEARTIYDQTFAGIALEKVANQSKAPYPTDGRYEKLAQRSV